MIPAITELLPERARWFVPVCEIAPGAFAGTKPLTLFRCLSCWGLVDAAGLRGHHTYHVMTGTM